MALPQHRLKLQAQAFVSLSNSLAQPASRPGLSSAAELGWWQLEGDRWMWPGWVWPAPTCTTFHLDVASPHLYYFLNLKCRSGHHFVTLSWYGALEKLHLGRSPDPRGPLVRGQGIAHMPRECSESS